MNIDSNSECVRSKYFTRQSDMDESLSDFQEVKKGCKGPKPAQKPAKPKSRKVTKRIKGQNDIRTALKGKKNELIAYSKQFDNVCKKSGLDVDSEQLQLAIALSKSLETESNAPETSQALSSQQRVAKIRKTLQEYGFKVPEAKISAGKKPKKYRKQYKLLTVTEEEKHQNITEKYTRIFFEHLDQSKVEQDSSNSQEPVARIFYLASNIPYECIKDNNIFYVGDLVEKSTTSGSLLRDWSEIPGRPESPKLIDTYAMNFKDIDCSQDELDIILSGPIKTVKDIFASKEIEYKRKYKNCDVPKIVIEDEGNVSTEDIGSKMDMDVINSNIHESNTAQNMSLAKVVIDSRAPVKILLEDKTLVTEDIELISPIKQVKSPSKEVISIETSNKQYRSCSPDIFDDELSSIMETSKPIVLLSQEHKTKVFSQDNYMDLTQCANIPSQNSEKGIQLSQNVTKRKSNDFMEITDCIASSSQHIREELKEIDLTQSSDDNGAIVEVDHNMNVGDNVSKNATDSISQNITDEQQITVLSKHHNTDSRQADKENIDLTQSSNEDNESRTNIELHVPGKKVEESMDLTQTSNSTDISLPLVDVGNSQTQASLDDTIVVEKEEYIAKIKKSCLLTEASSQVFDLTQAQDASIEYHGSPVKVGSAELCSNSFYEEFVHEHSTNTENSKEMTQNSDLNQHNSTYNESKESNEDIDLTQGSSSSEEIVVSQRPVAVFEKVPNNSSLGKQDDVSIDYDEIIIEDNINNKESFRDNEKNSSLTQQYGLSKDNNDVDIVYENNDLDINSSQNSELGFQISDRELDYSLHESRKDFPRDKGSGKDNLTQQDDSLILEGDNDIEILDDNDDDINSSQNSEAFQISDRELNYSIHKSRRDFSTNNFDVLKENEDKNMDLKYDSKNEVNDDIEIVDEDNEADAIHSSQNFDKELDYPLNKSRRDFPGDNFEFGGISILDNVTKLESTRKSLSEGCQPYFNENKNDTVEDTFLPEVYIKKTENKIIETTQLEAEGISPIKVQEVLKSNNGIFNIKTPKNSEYIIKTVDVTPMADFASMSTPQRNRELDRYGLKPLKRKRAIQMLTHIYNQMHPTIQQLTNEDQPTPKKPRTNTYTQDSPPKRSIISPENSPSKIVTGCSKTPLESPLKFTWKKPTNETRLHASPKKTDVLERDSHISSATSSKSTEESETKTPVKSPRKFVYKKPRQKALPSKNDNLESDSNKSFTTSCSRPGKLNKGRNRALSPILPNELERDRDIFSAPLSTKANEIRETNVCGYEITSEVAVLKSVDCNPDDWVFQKREKAKIHSCRVPLHIAFHNYVLSRRSLREAILKYEPVNIDVIHKDLVGYGHRYDPKASKAHRKNT